MGVTRIAFIGDAHVANFARHGGPKVKGFNTRGELAFYTVRDALREARLAGATLAVLLGDVVDSMRPEPQIIAALRALFREMNAHGLAIVLLKGNHDSASDLKGDCALYAMQEECTYVVDVPRVIDHEGQALCLVPFRSGAITEWLPGVLAELAPPANAILCLHAGIKDKETAPWLQSAPDAIEREFLTELMNQYDIGECFAGNWHDHRVWEAEAIHQVGALCPTGFSNLGIEPYGRVALWTLDEDDSTSEGITTNFHIEYLTIPGPRFLKLGRDESPAKLFDTSSKSGHKLFVEWHVAPENYERAKLKMVGCLEDGTVFAGSVLPDASGVQEGLTEAAFAARLAVGIDEAVSAYVGAMKIPDHLQRESVEARVRSFLGGTG